MSTLVLGRPTDRISPTPHTHKTLQYAQADIWCWCHIRSLVALFSLFTWDRFWCRIIANHLLRTWIISKAISLYNPLSQHHHNAGLTPTEHNPHLPTYSSQLTAAGGMMAQDILRSEQDSTRLTDIRYFSCQMEDSLN